MCSSGVDLHHPVRQVHARLAALVEDVRVGPAAGEPELRLDPAAGAPRSERDGEIAAVEPSTAVALLDRRLRPYALERLAAKVIVSRISSRGLRASAPSATGRRSRRSTARARCSSRFRSVMRPTFAVVSSSSRPRRRSAMAREAAAIADRPSSWALPGVRRRLFADHHLDSTRRRMPRTTWPIGAPWSKTNPVPVLQARRVECLGPRSPTSSFGVKSSLIPACGRRAGLRFAGQLEHWWRRRPCCPRRGSSRRRFAPRAVLDDGSSAAVGGTVSRCVQRKTGRRRSARSRGSRASRLPASEPIRC